MSMCNGSSSTVADGRQFELQNERIFDIGDVLFSQVAEDEMKQFAGKVHEEGVYKGYKPRSLWVGVLRFCFPTVLDCFHTRCFRRSTTGFATSSTITTVSVAPAVVVGCAAH